MKDLIKLENIGNLEVLENITNWSEIKNHVKIRNEKGDDGKMYIYLDPQLEDLTVGARLAFVREFRGLTQDAVAEYLELEGENRRRTVTRYETNKRKVPRRNSIIVKPIKKSKRVIELSPTWKMITDLSILTKLIIILKNWVRYQLILSDASTTRNIKSPINYKLNN